MLAALERTLAEVTKNGEAVQARVSELIAQQGQLESQAGEIASCCGQLTAQEEALRSDIAAVTDRKHQASLPDWLAQESVCCYWHLHLSLLAFPARRQGASADKLHVKAAKILTLVGTRQIQAGFDIPPGILRDWPSDSGKRGIKGGHPKENSPDPCAFGTFQGVAPKFSDQALGVNPGFDSTPVKPCRPLLARKLSCLRVLCGFCSWSMQHCSGEVIFRPAA